jgi:23S rRNA pseudouridine2605 synthase
MGLASRREVERWIEAGRVSVNGHQAELGARVGPTDVIRVDGRILDTTAMSDPARTRVLLYHKPEGEVCTRQDPEGRATVFDNLPRLRHGRWVQIGRLDINTSGLLLFTDNGELANRLMHPSHELVRVYAVRVHGEVSDGMKQRLRKGVELEDGMASFLSIEDAGGEGSNHWYRVTIAEGRNREVRRLWQSQGVEVSRLIRVAFGPVELPRDLPRGRWRYAEPELVRALGSLVGLELSGKLQERAGKRRVKARPSTLPRKRARQKSRPGATRK